MNDRHVCLDCRTLLHDATTCDGGKRHRVVRLGSEPGREALLSEVWGPADRRRQAKQMATAGGAGTALGSLAEGCGACPEIGTLDEALGAIVVVVAIALVVVVLTLLVVKAVELVRRHMNKLRPKGALAGAPPLRGAARVGVAAPARALGELGATQHPTTSLAAIGAECLAYGLEHRASGFAGGIMFRDAWTSGMTLTVEGGEKVVIPAGRVRVEGPWARLDPEARERERVRVAAVCPVGADEHDPFPFDDVYAVTLNAGDTVRVVGELISAPDPTVSAGYRAAGAVLVPVGIPRLQLVAKA